MRWLTFRLCRATRSSYAFSRWFRFVSASCVVAASYCERARSSESDRLWSWPMTACASARFDPIEGSATAGTAATRATQIPTRTYGACPNLRITNPWAGAGRAHREGPVRHESGRLAMFPDGRQPRTCAKLEQICTKYPLLPGSCGTVSPRSWAGRTIDRPRLTGDRDTGHQGARQPTRSARGRPRPLPDGAAQAPVRAGRADRR